MICRYIIYSIFLVASTRGCPSRLGLSSRLLCSGVLPALPFARCCSSRGRGVSCCSCCGLVSLSCSLLCVLLCCLSLLAVRLLGFAFVLLLGPSPCSPLGADDNISCVAIGARVVLGLGVHLAIVSCALASFVSFLLRTSIYILLHVFMITIFCLLNLNVLIDLSVCRHIRNSGD